MVVMAVVVAVAVERFVNGSIVQALVADIVGVVGKDIVAGNDLAVGIVVILELVEALVEEMAVGMSLVEALVGEMVVGIALVEVLVGEMVVGMALVGEMVVGMAWVAEWVEVMAEVMAVDMASVGELVEVLVFDIEAAGKAFAVEVVGKASASDFEIFHYSNI